MSLCFCPENIPEGDDSGSCQGGLWCQHLNRIFSGCSHLIPTVSHFQSLFQSFYLGPKAFNCFLSVAGLESAQVPGWRDPLGHGLLHEQPCLLPRAVPSLLSGLCVDKSTLKGLGTGGKTQVMGGFVALLDGFSPEKIFSPSVSLEEAGERCGKSLQEHGYLLQLVLQGFWTHMFTFLSLQAMPETWRKPTLSGFPPSNGVAQNGSGKREGFSSRNFGRWHFE